MGLDNIAKISWKDGEYLEAPADWFSNTPRLVRGVLGEDNWLRGKVYHNLIQSVTGYTLYQNLNNAAVSDLSNKLNEYTLMHIASPVNRIAQISNEELTELNRWFKTAAERGCFIDAWY